MTRLHDRHQHDDHLPYVSVEHLSRRYAPVRVRKIEHVFAKLGGIVPGEGANLEDEEDDIFDDEEPEVERAQEPRVALDDVSFDARGGSCVGLVGPTGSGKSVLMKIIAGLAPPTSGRVVVHGRLAAAIDSSIGLFPRTGKVGAGLPLFAGFHGISPRTARRHFQDVADSMELPNLRKQYMGLMTRKHRQALMVTLALNVDADIVLIDTSMPVIVRTTSIWQERMLELKRQGVLLIVTGPDADSVSWIADRVIRLERGVIVSDELAVATNEAPGTLYRREQGAEPRSLEAELVPAPGEF